MIGDDWSSDHPRKGEGSMRECTGSCLNEVMVRYDRAVAKRARGPTDEETAQQVFDQLRDEVIRPLMTACGEVLEAHGHHCRVYDKPISVTTPGNLTQNAEIIMHILPKEGAVPPATHKDYRLSFLLAQEHRKLLARMTHGRWEESCSSCPHDLHPLEGVTPELIEAELGDDAARVRRRATHNPCRCG